MTFKILIGLEIEGIINLNNVGWIDAGAWHGTNHNKMPFSEYFFCEADSSLTNNYEEFDTDDEDEDNNLIGIEFISNPIELNELPKVLDDFKNSLYKLTAKHKGITLLKAKERYRLKDLIEFDCSTGCHVNISIIRDSKEHNLKIINREDELKINKTKQFNIYKNLSMDFFHKFNNNLREKLLINEFGEILESYFRSYSRARITIKDLQHTKDGCFNNIKPNILEFRSWNLRGIRSWNNFYKAFGLLTETINETILDELNKDKPFINTKLIYFDIEEFKTERIEEVIKCVI